MMRHGVKGAVTIDARITDLGAGGFTAVASTGDVDRDGEIIVPGAFDPLPAAIPVHLDHVTTAANVVARARPYYAGTELRIDATFGSDKHAQAARSKVAEGLVDSVSVVFLASEKRDVQGVPTIFRAELACDLVSIPSNRGARILASRSLRWAMGHPTADARAEALLLLADVEIADAKALLKTVGAASPPRRGRNRQLVDAEIRSILSAPSTTSRRSL